ncbi:MAG: hypothetical protein ABI472_04825 [Ginsengibacter sp.]
MKIRIKGNEVRFRLSKPEVALFAEKGYVEEKAAFESGTFGYVVTSTDAAKMSADFMNGIITLFVPERLLQQWASTDLVGLDDTMPVKDGNDVYILLEKDFKCIEAIDAKDQSDYFENPSKSC